MPAVDKALLASTLSENLRRFGKGGNAFYDRINVLHKSVRGSDPDSMLYWSYRMLDGDTNPRYLACRIIRMVWGGVGLADPRARRITLDAAGTYERLDSSEGELALTQAMIYPAIMLKSNADCNAYSTARAFVSQNKSCNVSVYLRGAPTKLIKEFGYGHTYCHAHDKPEVHTIGETYFPDDLLIRN